MNRRAVIRSLSAGIASVATARIVCAASAPPPSIETRDDLARVFREAGTAGTMVVQRDDRIVVIDIKRAETGFLPASTFKIPNALIALETGVCTDADTPLFPWDGEKRSIEAWNQAHTLRSGFKASSVPTFQEIARRVGAERMKQYVEAFGYGNRNIGGRIDFFWLGGDLRISAFEQIAFLQRLHSETLPASTRTQAIVKEIMLAEEGEGFAVRGKTGWAGFPQPGLGWWVGWVERGEAPAFFALNLDITDPKRHPAARMTIAKAVLRETGVL
jgi:beta-lactamase class D